MAGAGHSPLVRAGWADVLGEALQRSANRAEEQRAVKADADHEALSYIVAALDELRKR